jgi:hypothetical protein
VSERIEKLKDAVETAHRCEALHVRSEPVIEVFDGKVVWEGVVEIFDLEGHAKAKRCYAWLFLENGEPQYTTVLELPPVDSAQTAVQVAIASKSKGDFSIFFEKSKEPRSKTVRAWLLVVAAGLFAVALLFYYCAPR